MGRTGNKGNRKGMRDFRVDLHIHSHLSPCGDHSMSPRNIIRRARELLIDIVGITDHNSTRHGPLMRELGREEGVLVLTGAEVTSREGVHCLAFFENDEQLGVFQQYLDDHLESFLNEPAFYGHQLLVDRYGNILEEMDNLLINPIVRDIDQIERDVHRLEGLFIPAHINRPVTSLMSQLGFVPPGIGADALELSRYTGKKEFLDENPDLSGFTFIHSSDAHFIDHIGRGISVFRMKDASFGEIRMALLKKEGREVVLP